MIRRSLFVAILLLPCVAYADPSSSLSISVVPAGSTPPVPAGAAAAGFTTLALNSDFTQQMPDKWLGGCANPGNGQPVSPQFSDDGGPHIWWLNIWWSANYQPCNVVQKADPKFGGMVLDLPWTVQNSYATVGTVLESASWNYNRSTGAGQGHFYPRGKYTEIVARIEPVTQRGTYMVFHTWGQDGIAGGVPGGAEMEWDVMETDADQLLYYDSAVHNWGGSGGGWILQPWTNLAPGTNYDPANYNTYGLRITHDGANAVGCTYVNNVLQKCSAPVPISSDEAAEREFLVFYTACDQWNMPNGVCNEGMQQHMYVKSVRVWSCQDWAATQCSGTVLTSTP